MFWSLRPQSSESDPPVAPRTARPTWVETGATVNQHIVKRHSLALAQIDVARDRNCWNTWRKSELTVMS